MTDVEETCCTRDENLLSFGEALRILKVRTQTVVGRERVGLSLALGRILAENITAPRDVPPYDNAAVDGYGVRHCDLRAEEDTHLPINARIAAGHPVDRPAKAGEAMRIFTGAPMPEGLDTVLMQEDVHTDGSDVVIPAHVAANVKVGANRRRRGEDVTTGDIILHTGRILRAQEIALAASVGVGELWVCKRLRAAVFSTGDEIADPVMDEAGEGAIYDANRYSVAALLRGLGCEVTDLGILSDGVAEIRSALHDAAPGHDVIITSGGVSLGEEDHIAHVVKSLGSLDFWRLAIKPGRPLALGSISGTAFVGLPGNPVAAMVSFMRIVRPLILALAGRTDGTVRAFKVPAAFDMDKKTGRREWLRCKLIVDEKGVLHAEKYPHQGSGVLTSMVACDGLVELAEDVEHVRAGELVDFLPFVEMTN